MKAVMSPEQPLERRHLGRPTDHDTRPCPTCNLQAEFNERFEFDGEVMPAWVCVNPNCPRIIARRRTPRADTLRSDEVVREARNVQAMAKRSMMKSHACYERSLILAAESKARITGQALSRKGRRNRRG